MQKYYFLLLLASAGFIASCKKDDKKPENTAATTGTVKLEIDHQWAGTDLALETDYTHPVSGDTLQFTTFRYYLSNLQLQREDGTWWTQPESYYLVDLADGSLEDLTIPNVPPGNYTDLKITFGIDSTHNVSGAQSGALSVTHGMFWTWNTGYIMTKAEGISPNAPSNSFAFHLAGFTGMNAVVRTRNYHFNDLTLTVAVDHTSEIGMKTNVNTLLNDIELAQTYNIQSTGATALAMSLDFYGGFTFDHLHN